MNEFLVKYKSEKEEYWIDINNGERFVECDVPWKIAKHGLCKILKRKVIKKIADDGFPPLVFKSMNPESPKFPNKRVSVPFRDADGKKSTWIFEPYEISEAIKGIQEGLNDKKLCIKVGCPHEAATKLRSKLEGGLMEKFLGGDKEHGTKRNKALRRRISTRSRNTIARKDTRR